MFFLINILTCTLGVFMGHASAQDNTITYLIQNAGPWRLYCFACKEEAESSLSLIQEALKEEYPELVEYGKVTHIPSHAETPYRFRLSKEQHRSWSQLQKTNQLALATPNDKILIKSIRWDKYCYIKNAILSYTKSAENQFQEELRVSTRGRYTTYASGVYRRDQKPSPYGDIPNLEQKKQKRSKHQSTSLVTPRIQPPVFGHSTVRKDKLVGFIFAAEDALINRIMKYDGGTITRPYEKRNKDKAERYYKNGINNFLFHTLDDLEQALLSKQETHNEVLARLRWHIETSKLALFGGSFEARCIVQYYAECLLMRLKKQYEELDKPWDEAYQIPIVYYMPGDEKNWHAYTEYDQKIDRYKAYVILNDANKCTQKCEQQDFEFLLLLKEHDLADFLAKNIPLITQLWEQEDWHLLTAFYDKSANAELFKEGLQACSKTIGLHDFSSYYDLSLAGMLIESKKTDLEMRDDEDCTVLMRAVSRGNTKLVEYLLQKGADVESVCENGDTALSIAVYGGFFDMVQLLYAHGARLDVVLKNTDGDYATTLLHRAVIVGNSDIIYFLLKHGPLTLLNETFQHGLSPLHAAIEVEDIDLVQGLIEQGADVVSKGKYSLSVLHVAVNTGNPDLVELLLICGADINAVYREDDMVLTPLAFAVQNGDIAMVQLLIKHGADAEILCSKGATALYFAAKHGYLEIVKCLLSQEVAINVRRKEDGLTPFLIAAKNGHLEVMRVLLEAGANYLEKNFQGEEVYDLVPDNLQIQVGRLISVFSMVRSGRSTDSEDLSSSSRPTDSDDLISVREEPDNERDSLYLIDKVDGNLNDEIQVVQSEKSPSYTPFEIAASICSLGFYVLLKEMVDDPNYKRREEDTVYGKALLVALLFLGTGGIAGIGASFVVVCRQCFFQPKKPELEDQEVALRPYCH